MGKDAGGSDTETVTRVIPPSFSMPGLNLAGREAVNLFNQGPQQFFPGQTFAGFDPLQEQGQQAQLQFASQALPQLNQQIFGSFGQALDAQNVLENPAISAGLQTIEDRAQRNFTEQILPQLRQQATGTGNQFSSRAQLAEERAARDLQGAISEAQAGLLTGTLGDAMRLQGAGLSIAPQTLGTGLLGGSIFGDVGSQRQGLEQQQISEDMARFNFEQQAPGMLLDQLLNRSVGLAGTGGTTISNSSVDQGSSTLGNVLGGGLLGSSLSGTNFMQGLSRSFSPFAFLGGPTLPIAGAVLGGLLS